MGEKEEQRALKCRPFLFMGLILAIFFLSSCASNDKSRIRRIDNNDIPSVSNKFSDEIFEKK
jgi:hypothetical protein